MKATTRTYVRLKNGTVVQVMPQDDIPAGAEKVHEFPAEGGTEPDDDKTSSFPATPPRTTVATPPKTTGKS